MISPLLFVIYLGELIEMMRKCKGIFVDDEIPEINILLYADDLVLCADTPGRLQELLDTLSEFCDKWGLLVNMTKTNIMVFRRGGIIKKNERWFYKGIEVDI